MPTLKITEGILHLNTMLTFDGERVTYGELLEANDWFEGREDELLEIVRDLNAHGEHVVDTGNGSWSLIKRAA